MNKVKFSIIVCLAMFVVEAFAQVDNLPIYKGKYQATDASLKNYKYPEWFRDVKFGIWSHWGPQAVPRQGDWYARCMYEHDWYDCEKSEYRKAHGYYRHHVKTYGHPSEFGFKDIIPLWKAERWNPDELMQLFKRVGARYFVSMATHHDNFFLWNSKLHPKWNSVNMGPKKDVVALWQSAAKKQGLYFGVSEHLGASYNWYRTAHQADRLGDKAGVKYDGNNPEYFDLYHEKPADDDHGWYTKNPKYHRQWFDRIQELIDGYHPDLLYTDGGLPFEDVGRSLVAHYYNQDAKQKKPQGVVYTCKQASDGRWVQDYERGSAESIREYPWQTDTSIGDWYYRTGQKYMTGSEIIQMLIDIVSKNGNLLLNVVQTPEGDLEKDVLNILEEIAKWMEVNSEAIYGTRPWKIFGEGPSLEGAEEKAPFGHIANAVKDVRKYRSGDLRFTTKGKKLYVFAMEQPEGDIHIKSLGLKAATGRKISSIKLLGSTEKVKWTQTATETVISKPSNLPKFTTLVFEVK